MIVVVGEALIDLIADETGALHRHAGGGPFNTAVALGGLGVPVGFLGRLSRDAFGQLLESRLVEAGVDSRYILHGDASTPLAVVDSVAGGGHEFTFYLAETAYADLTEDDFPPLDEGVAVLCAGTLALATDPPAGAIEALLERQSPRVLIVIDPNVRPAIFGDAASYRSRFERLARFTHVVKLSDEDANWLYPGRSAEDVLDGLLRLGVRLVVLTQGADGALAKTAASSGSAPAPVVDVIDTVGAGDAFGAGLLYWLWANGRLSIDEVGALAADDLAQLLRFAAAAGALQCSRVGATPVCLAEIEALLGTSPGWSPHGQGSGG